MVLWVAEARKGSHHVNVQPRCDGLHEVRFLKRKEQPLQKCDGDSTHVFRMLLILQHFIFLKLVCNSVGSGKFRIGWLRESVRENQTAHRDTLKPSPLGKSKINFKDPAQRPGTDISSSLSKSILGFALPFPT